jgi:type IV pilus assembly protein PilN
MIRINLIPTKRKKKAKPLATYLVSAVFVIIATIALGFFANTFLGSKIKDLNKESAANAKLIKSLDKKIQEVKDFEKIKKKFTDRKKVIEDLRAGQSLPVRLLDELSMKLTDGIWFKTLTIQNENVSLSGIGFNNNEIVDFVQDMKGSELFSEVMLKGTKKTKINDVEAFTFSISLSVGK